MPLEKHMLLTFFNFQLGKKCWKKNSNVIFNHLQYFESF